MGFFLGYWSAHSLVFWNVHFGNTLSSFFNTAHIFVSQLWKHSVFIFQHCTDFCLQLQLKQTVWNVLFGNTLSSFFQHCSDFCFPTLETLSLNLTKTFFNTLSQVSLSFFYKQFGRLFRPIAQTASYMEEGRA